MHNRCIWCIKDGTEKQWMKTFSKLSGYKTYKNQEPSYILMTHTHTNNEIREMRGEIRESKEEKDKVPGFFLI